MKNKQVDKSHYKFKKYVDKGRWLSIWHQLDEILSLEPKTVLEVGPGLGLLKAFAGYFGSVIKTVDIDPALSPDCVASAIDLPFNENTFDCACAFQMLEHLPYDQSLEAFNEMVRVSKSYILISLPDAKKIWVYSFFIPKVGQKVIHIPKPQLRQRVHDFDGQHYWEINKQGYSLQNVIDDFMRNDIEMIKTYRMAEEPYYRFFVFKKTGV